MLDGIPECVLLYADKEQTEEILEHGGKLDNCTIVRRDGDRGPLFASLFEHGIMANLDGYAVIPVEDYDKMLDLIGVSRLSQLTERGCFIKQMGD